MIKSRPEVHIIESSINEQDIRITSFQLRYWRPIHAELMTHRVFSRCAGSSRARPTPGIIKQVCDMPWGPVHWGKNQKGMQASEELSAEQQEEAKKLWIGGANQAAGLAMKLWEIDGHKQWANRPLEAFSYIDVIVTSTCFNNWFALRDHKDAQPEIRDLAHEMRVLFEAASPQFLKPGDWHLPYHMADDEKNIRDYFAKTQGLDRIDSSLITQTKLRVSTARCARVSYKAFNGQVATIEEDLELFDRLLTSQPVHASPAEHQATPDTQSLYETYLVSNNQRRIVQAGLDWDHPGLHGNFKGYIQHRKLLPNEFVPG